MATSDHGQILDRVFAAAKTDIFRTGTFTLEDSDHEGDAHGSSSNAAGRQRSLHFPPGHGAKAAKGQGGGRKRKQERPQEKPAWPRKKQAQQPQPC